jgi:twitching motility protein PilI
MAKKFNLREFQTTLSQQLQAAASRDNSGSRLGFRVGDVNWLVSLSDTEEVRAAGFAGSPISAATCLR